MRPTHDFAMVITPTIHWATAEPRDTYAKISFTFSRVCWLRDGFRYRMVLSMSE